jgi:hypothetical protein
MIETCSFLSQTCQAVVQQCNMVDPKNKQQDATNGKETKLQSETRIWQQKGDRNVVWVRFSTRRRWAFSQDIASRREHRPCIAKGIPGLS